MKLSKLIRALFDASEFTNANSLAQHTGQTQPFVSAMLSGEKDSAAKMDVVFEALTEGVTVKEMVAALELITTVRKMQIEREQIL